MIAPSWPPSSIQAKPPRSKHPPTISGCSCRVAEAGRAYGAGDLDNAERIYRRIAASFEGRSSENASQVLGVIYHHLGASRYRGGLDEAEGWYKKSLAIKETPGDQLGMAHSYHHLGMVAQDRGRLNEAEGWYKKSLAILEVLGDQPHMAVSYHQLGNVAYFRGGLDEAEGWYKKSLAICETLGNLPEMALSYHQLGVVADFLRRSRRGRGLV